MLWRLILFLLLALASAAPASASKGRITNIRPELVIDGPAQPGAEVDLAIVMTPRPGWHGYWLNPGDAGLPMEVDWLLPEGAEIRPLRYPVPTRLTIAGLMNYVYKGPYAVLTRLKIPPDARGTILVAATARWLACTDEVCVPEEGGFHAAIPLDGSLQDRDRRFDEWRQALPRPLSSKATFEITGDQLRVAIPLPADAEVERPYVFPAADGPVDYASEQSFRRTDDALIAELPRRRGEPAIFAGVVDLGGGRGLSFEAVPGDVPDGGRALTGLGAEAIMWAVLGALAGGLLLNLMPCVFPILALKALHLARSGGDEAEARRDSLAYAAGAVVGTGLLGAALLAIRASGTAVGWAFQLQDPRTIMLLLLLATAIAVNLAGLFALPTLAGRARPGGSFGTGALAAFVATPCAGPFLGAALGTALLLPALGSLLVFAALGFGLAIPFIAIAFIPALRRSLPAPGPWMVRLQRVLAIPMAATVVACLWLLWRQGGETLLWTGLAATLALVMLLAWFGRRQRSGMAVGLVPLALTAVVIAGALVALPQRPTGGAVQLAGVERWSEAAVDRHLASGRPAFVYFTADWCLTCKVNEATAIDRDDVREAFEAANVEVFAGDWTNGDPAITRFLEARGRAGVPLYLWYEPGKPPEELPQVLTASMLTSRARRDP